MSLTKSEEQLMNHLWKLKKAFIKDILTEYEDPKPAMTTVLTLIKRMIDKGYVDFKLFGNSREYYPLVEKSEYFKVHFNAIIKDFFNDSPMQMVSFFATETNLSQEQLEELRAIIDKQIDHKK